MELKKENNVAISDNDTYISRIIDAPRELVFKVWTEAEHLKHWFAPRGCTIHFAKIDIREGGGFLSCIKNPNYPDCWCKGSYIEIKAPERIIYKLEMTNEKGDLVVPDNDWPQATVVTVSFMEMGRKTKFTLHQTVPEGIAKQKGAYQGWIDMFDILDEYINFKIHSDLC